MSDTPTGMGGGGNNGGSADPVTGRPQQATANKQPQEIVLDSSVDQYLENLPVGSIAKAIGNNLYGINHKQMGNAVPRSKDMYGFTFFTRPQLNLTKMNLSNYRGFYSMMTDNDMSYQKYTRLMLDPRIVSSKEQGASSPFVDPLNPFIPLLTNNVTSVSGWPDISAPTYTTETGLYGQESGFVDGVTNHYESFDLDVSFKNFKGNPLIYFFHVWVKYETLVFEGVLNPYLDMITENEIDYNTRIYRLILDQNKKYVTYIGSTGASFPLNVPTGSIFDFSTDTPYNTKNEEISIRFRSFGFIAFEDILKLKFNQTVALFNPNMRAILKSDFNNLNQEAVARESETILHKVHGSSYVKVPHSVAMGGDMYDVGLAGISLNHRCYPYINLVTNELELWTDSNRFKL